MKEDPKIKVLMLAEWFPNDDDPQLGIFIQKHAAAVAQYAEVKLIYAYGVKGQKENFVFQKESNGYLDIVKTKFKKSTGILRYRNFFRYRIALQKAFLETDFIPDVVHVHVPGRNTFLATFLKRKYNIPFVVTEHWHGWLKGVYQEDKKRRWWMQKILRRASYITVVSEELQQAINSTFPHLFDQKIKRVPNVVEKSKDQGEKKNNHILFVGDLDDEVKDVSGVIKAFATFIESNLNWRLDIVGSGKDEDDLKALAGKICPENIRFMGRLSNEETLKCYPRYSFLVANSTVETFGVAMAEALMAGIPVVAPEGTAADVFLNETNSIRFNKEAQEGLLHALIEMSDNVQEFNSEELKNTVKEFNSRTVGRSFNALYQNVLK